jgi:hypothetical protein
MQKIEKLFIDSQLNKIYYIHSNLDKSNLITINTYTCKNSLDIQKNITLNYFKSNPDLFEKIL